MPRAEQPQFAIDLVKWKGKTPQTILEDLSTLGHEAKEGDFAERTNVAVVSLTAFEKLIREESLDPEDIATVCIYKWSSQIPPALTIKLKSKNPQPEEILSSLFKTSIIDPKEIIIWLSPKIENRYKESRAVIYFPISINGGKFLMYYAICGQENKEEYASIASQLLLHSTKKEELNKYPVPVIVPQNIHWTNYLENYFGYPKVWNAIRNNQVIENKIKTYASAREIVEEKYVAIQNLGPNYYLQYEIGREIELALERNLNMRLIPGACGGLYKDQSTFLNPFSFFIPKSITTGNETTSSRRKHCGKCGKAGYFAEGETCPYTQRND